MIYETLLFVIFLCTIFLSFTNNNDKYNCFVQCLSSLYFLSIPSGDFISLHVNFHLILLILKICRPDVKTLRRKYLHVFSWILMTFLFLVLHTTLYIELNYMLKSVDILLIRRILLIWSCKNGQVCKEQSTVIIILTFFYCKSSCAKIP